MQISVSWLLSESFFWNVVAWKNTVCNNINSQFCQQISFGANDQFGLNLGKNYVTLYLMNSSKDLFEMLQSDLAY